MGPIHPRVEHADQNLLNAHPFVPCRGHLNIPVIRRIVQVPLTREERIVGNRVGIDDDVRLTRSEGGIFKNLSAIGGDFGGL